MLVYVFAFARRKESYIGNAKNVIYADSSLFLDKIYCYNKVKIYCYLECHKISLLDNIEIKLLFLVLKCK